MHPKKYFNNKEDFVQFIDKLKLISCPYCDVIGTLVLDGPYNNKGHRCLCSNRHKKNGCGRTFCFLWGSAIRNHTVKTNELWSFLIKLFSVNKISQTLKSIAIPFTRRAVNHWLSKLRLCQSTIRFYLVKICSPPLIHVSDPLLQTIFHLKNCFPDKCPVQEYQSVFQRSIFDI